MDLPQRYLSLLKSSLLNEIYLENEVRFLYIFSRLALEKNVDLEVVREIHLRLPEWVAMVKEARKEGNVWWRLNAADGRGNNRALDLRGVVEFSHTMMGAKRMDNIEFCLDAVRRDRVPGDLIETGVWRGGQPAGPGCAVRFLCAAIWQRGIWMIERSGSPIRLKACRCLVSRRTSATT